LPLTTHQPTAVPDVNTVVEVGVHPTNVPFAGTLVATGKLRPRESVAQGLASAPEAFLGLLKGKNFGKQLVKLI
jgi:NADPH-dependent curcumin reductase CurA